MQVVAKVVLQLLVVVVAMVRSLSPASRPRLPLNAFMKACLLLKSLHRHNYNVLQRQQRLRQCLWGARREDAEGVGPRVRAAHQGVRTVPLSHRANNSRYNAMNYRHHSISTSCSINTISISSIKNNNNNIIYTHQ